MNPRSWVWGRDGPRWPVVVLVLLSCAVVVAVGVAGATSTTSFGPFNPSWDGASDLRNQVDEAPAVEGELVTETSRYSEVDPDDTVAIVIAPDKPYQGADIAHVRQFVEDGGTLVVMENFGPGGEQLIADVGADAQPNGGLLKDDLNYYQAPAMPVAAGVENHTLTTGVDQLTLNYATAIQPGNATVLIRTSEFAYLVDNDSQGVDDADELSAYPVATVETVENGSVVVVGDPSISINAMVDQPDNGVFLERLYTQGDTVLFDVSHNEQLPVLTQAVVLIRGSAPAQVLIGLVGVAGVWLLSRRPIESALRRFVAHLPAGPWSPAVSTRRHHSTSVMSDDGRAEYLRRRHPEWDEERIQRVIKALNRPGTERDDNE